MSDDEQLTGEIGRMHGVIFVDDEGNPLPPPDPSRCPECGLTRPDGTYWDEHLFWPSGSITRWRCPNGHVWVDS